MNKDYKIRAIVYPYCLIEFPNGERFKGWFVVETEVDYFKENNVEIITMEKIEYPPCKWIGVAVLRDNEEVGIKK